MEKLPEVKLNDQLVLTTEQLADFYDVTSKQIKQNFANNKGKFVEGVHYLSLEGNALKEFKSQVENIDLPINKFASHLYLWTKRGASRHSKMLGTDRAWDMYGILEENYFNPKPVVKKLSVMEQLKLQNKALVEVDAKIDDAIGRVTTLEDTMRVSGVQEKQLQDAAKLRVFKVLGGKDSNAYQKMGSKIFRQCWHDFKKYFQLPRYSELPRIKQEAAIEFLGAWLPDTETRLEIAQHNAQGELFEED